MGNTQGALFSDALLFDHTSIRGLRTAVDGYSSQAGVGYLLEDSKWGDFGADHRLWSY